MAGAVPEDAVAGSGSSWTVDAPGTHPACWTLHSLTIMRQTEARRDARRRWREPLRDNLRDNEDALYAEELSAKAEAAGDEMSLLARGRGVSGMLWHPLLECDQLEQGVQWTVPHEKTGV